MTIYRQGDVLLIAVAVKSRPADVSPVNRDRGRVVLADGEVTGHAHAIADTHAILLSDAETDRRWLEIVGADALLVHEEHATITLPPGLYVVRRQREYTSADMPSRMVAD